MMSQVDAVTVAGERHTGRHGNGFYLSTVFHAIENNADFSEHFYPQDFQRGSIGLATHPP